MNGKRKFEPQNSDESARYCVGSSACDSESFISATSASGLRRAVKRGWNRLARGTRAAFTLLEVILALALSVLVIGAISSALYFHLRILEDQRVRVEQALVARGLLQMMANDIRSGVQYKPIDMSQLETLLAGSDLGALMALSGTGLEEGDLGLEETESSLSDDTAEEAAPRPGLFGSAEVLQVDISRMPRRDEYLMGVAQDGRDFSSDLKSVTYLLVPTSSLDPSMMIGLPPVTAETMTSSFSLVRAQVSQSVARLAMQRGTDVATLGQMTVLANEVQTLSFSYFDGSSGDWVTDWDSEEMESLPAAVEIILSVRSPGSNSNPQDFPADTYRLVVHLPMAEPADDSSASSSSSNSSTTNQSQTDNESGGGT